MSKSATTATVETLTAEVRVLMVGNRQVTMSVFNQLDEIDPKKIEPFGRVRPRDAKTSEVHVVGLHPESGTLTKAKMAGPVGKVNVSCYAIQAVGPRRYHEWFLIGAPPVVMRDERGDYHYDLYERATMPKGSVKLEPKHEDAVMAEARRVAELITPKWELYRSWSNLPLIVLAGLR